MLYFIYDFDYLDISICVLTESCFKNLFEGLGKQAQMGMVILYPRIQYKYPEDWVHIVKQIEHKYLLFRLFMS